MSSEHDLVVSFSVHDAGGWARDVPLMAAALRAGVAAWEQSPPSGQVDAALRHRDFDLLREIADDLEAAHTDAVREVELSWKRERRERRRAEREAS